MLAENKFDTGELLLNYAEGPTSGPPLVLLHGLTGWWHSWEPVLPQLTADWHVYAVDLRGHGQSGRAGDHYLLSDYARDIAALLDQCVGQPAVLMGHSLGALTAMATAPLAPGRVRALVLVDPPLTTRNAPVSILPEAANWFRWVYETVQGGPTFDQVLERCRSMAPDLPPAELQGMAANLHGIAPGTVGVALQDRLLEGLDPDQVVRQIQCPVLLMRGDFSRGAAIRDEDATWFQTQSPHARIIQIPDGTHMFLWEQPETSLAHIHAFLQ
jgi:pimeloyl-ACP methyl ester carboxylesterase